MTAKEIAVTVSLVSAAFGGGYTTHMAAIAPTGVVHAYHVELTLRPQPDGGYELEEVAYGVRDGKHTGAALSCGPTLACESCVEQAADNCHWL